jgi:prlF antitoxin for toxin YhaV_toxin
MKIGSHAMPSNPFRRKSKPARATSDSAQTGYSGRRSKTGNSSGFRFEGALFKSHPEFTGEVRAHVIAPGRLLVTAEPLEELDSDPVLSSFLAFLSQDMLKHPESIRVLDEALMDEIASLTKGVQVGKDEDFGEENLLG